MVYFRRRLIFLERKIASLDALHPLTAFPYGSRRRRRRRGDSLATVAPPPPISPLGRRSGKKQFAPTATAAAATFGLGASTPVPSVPSDRGGGINLFQKNNPAHTRKCLGDIPIPIAISHLHFCSKMSLRPSEPLWTGLVPTPPPNSARNAQWVGHGGLPPPRTALKDACCVGTVVLPCTGVAAARQAALQPFGWDRLLRQAPLRHPDPQWPPPPLTPSGEPREHKNVLGQDRAFWSFRRGNRDPPVVMDGGGGR